MFDRVQHLIQPRQRIADDVKQRIQTQLHQPPVGDVADVLLDLPGGQSLNRTLLEREIDERVLVLNDRGAGQIEFSFEVLIPDFGILPDEGPEQADDGIAVQ